MAGLDVIGAAAPLEPDELSDGERWSTRKVLRRLVWHELLHYKQLRRLVPKVAATER